MGDKINISAAKTLHWDRKLVPNFEIEKKERLAILVYVCHALQTTEFLVFP